MSRKKTFLNKLAASALLMSLVTGGVVLYPSVAMAAPADARKVTATEAVAAIKTLQNQISQATDEAARSPLRLKLVAAYMDHGRPMEAVRELQTWLKNNPKAAEREAVILTLIAAQRESNDWDAAASLSRSFVRDYPKSASRDAVFAGLVEIARFGQVSPSGEASALAEWLAASPEAGGQAAVAARMLRLAKLQEQVGAVGDAIVTLQKFVAKYPNDEAANEAGWRVAYLMHDRMRRTAEAVDAGKAHLAKYPKRATISRDWQWIGELARNIEKYPEAIAALKKALAADPKNREAAVLLLDTLTRSGDSTEVGALSDQIAKNFVGDTLVTDARLAYLNKLLWEKKNVATVQKEAEAMLEKGSRLGETIWLYERAAAENKVSRADVRAKLKECYSKQTGWNRSELALRLSDALRKEVSLAEAQALLETELKENPVNRRELTRQYITGAVDTQGWEINGKKRTKYDMEGYIKKIGEVVKPNAYMPELRSGLEESASSLGQTRQKEYNSQLRAVLESLSQNEIAQLVDTVHRESRRDVKKGADALVALLKASKDKPAILQAVAGDATWSIFDRSKPEDRERILPWFAAVADSRPTDLGLNMFVGENFRRSGKPAEAVRFFARVALTPVTPQNAIYVGQGLGALIDIYGYDLQKLDEVEKLVAGFTKNSEQFPVQVQQERYRQLADLYGRQKESREKQVAYYRKAVNLGLSNAGYEAAKNLMIILPPQEAVTLGQQLMADPANARFVPELGLMVAQRQALGLKDLSAAVATIAKANEKRLTGATSDYDNWGTFREILSISLDLADGKRITDPQRKAFLADVKPLDEAQLKQLLSLGMQWLNSQQLHDVARELIRREGNAGNAQGQLDAFAQVLARTKSNDQWHWDRNMDIIRDEIARGNEGTASTMLRLLLKQSAGYSEAGRTAARSLLLNTYKKFGEDLLAVDEKSPIAPLLKGASYLRLGEEKTAWELYQQNSEIFAKRIDEVPSEYVLFVGNELAAGSDLDRDVAEQLLRTWLARADKQQNLEPSVRASVQLNLADVFYFARRFDVARAEYQSVIDKFPDTTQALDAQFRIGESFMYQKNYAEAGKVFDKLRKSKDPEVAIRGTFMSGVLQYTSGAREEARESFKTLLELSPTEDLASKALYQLALIYGDDNRFREMLDMLEAIGRLGREGKRWHTPGTSLTVMIHDPDMAIVQGATSVPVVVSTTSGDREVVTLTAGSAGKGIYLTDLPTALGAPKPGDGTLQLLGSDVISYDYPDEFKSKFKYVPPPQGNIRIASDGTFAVASTRIADVEKKTMVQRAEKETKIERHADEAKEFRSSGEVKPGNPLYIKVVDPDRSTNVGVNRVEVVARAASGDSVRAWINESTANSGVFEGVIRTAERPPEAVASDFALGKPAGLAADRDAASAWESQHDGQPGKWIAADLKDVYAIKEFSFTVPNEKSNAPVKYSVEVSNNGTLWAPVLSTEKGRIAHGLSLSYGPMRHTHYAWSKQKAAFGGGKSPDDLAGYMNTVASGKVPSIDATGVATLALPDVATDTEADVHSFVGYFYAPTTGKYTFYASAGQNGSAAVVIDGRIVAAKRSDMKDGVSTDLTAGWHRFAGFLTVRGDAKDRSAPATGFRFVAPGAKGNEGSQVLAGGTNERDGIPAPGLYVVPAEGTLKTAGAKTTADFGAAPISGRFMRLNVEKYDGDYVAISNMEVKGADGKVLLPTEADVVSIADDEILQVSPGDEISVSYSDQINTRTPGEARVLSGKLKATYYNGSIHAISYDVKSGAGGVVRTAKDLYRIDPGDRIVATITDYDEDTSPEVNKVPFKVRTESGVELVLEATETEATSGTFTKEIETGEGPGKLLVKPGERIYLIYTDRQNTSPGSRTDRVAEISVVKPTQGQVAIVPTRVDTGTGAAKGDAAKGGNVVAMKAAEPRVIYLPGENGKPARVVLAAPLTIEVIDQDAAKDSHSSVVVTVTTSAGAKIKVPLELSGAARPGGSGGVEPIVEGRFVGQALMVLGKPDETGKASENVSIERARGLIGAWRYADGEAGGSESGSIKAPILPVLGSDTITATYTDKRSPSAENQELTTTAKMVTDASLANLDRGFLEPVETIHLGEKLYLKVEDADRDITPEQDEISVTVASTSGEKLEIKLKETLGHSGTFTAEIATVHSAKPDPANGTLEANFGDTLTITYLDETHTQSASPMERKLAIQVALGADAAMTAFTKQFGNEEIAVETQFKLAECYFELFKSHNSLKASTEARAALEAGRAVLATVRDNYRGSNYEARVLYLLGGFHQELKEFDKAIECYQTIIRAYSNNAFAPDAQYKLAQCYEDKNEMEKACEEYVRLAYTYPDNPLIAKCMVRLSDYFYKSSKYLVAANICGQFLEQYPDHEWAPKIAFRQGQCFFKGAEALGKEGSEKGGARASAGEQLKNYTAAAKAFDLLVDRYTDSDLRADAMFWSGQSYHKAGDAAQAYRRYRRCTWDFPDSDAARYARGQLTLPEMLTAAKDDSSNK